MLDHSTINERLDQLEQAIAQNFELMNMRFERLEMLVEQTNKKLDMIAQQIEWQSKVLNRRFERIGSE